MKRWRKALLEAKRLGDSLFFWLTVTKISLHLIRLRIGLSAIFEAYFFSFLDQNWVNQNTINRFGITERKKGRMGGGERID